MEIYERLQALEAAGEQIAVGLVGCGQMGSGLVHVTRQMPGMETRAISDINVNRPLATLQELGVPQEMICITNHVGQAEDALCADKYVVTEDAVLLAQLESLDAVVEATGLTEIGSKVAWNCILNSKHVIMLNVETDVTVGVLLHRLATRQGAETVHVRLGVDQLPELFGAEACQGVLDLHAATEADDVFGGIGTANARPTRIFCPGISQLLSRIRHVVVLWWNSLPVGTRDPASCCTAQ